MYISDRSRSDTCATDPAGSSPTCGGGGPCEAWWRGRNGVGHRGSLRFLRPLPQAAFHAPPPPPSASPPPRCWGGSRGGGTKLGESAEERRKSRRRRNSLRIRSFRRAPSFPTPPASSSAPAASSPSRGCLRRVPANAARRVAARPAPGQGENLVADTEAAQSRSACQTPGYKAADEG